MSAQRQQHHLYHTKPALSQWQSILSINPTLAETNNGVSEHVRQKLTVCLLEHIRTTTPPHIDALDTPTLTVFSNDTRDWFTEVPSEYTQENTQEQTHPSKVTNNSTITIDADPWQLVQSIVWALTLTGMILLLGPSILASAIGDSLGSVQFY